jgi:hypothetical protein
MPGMEGDAMTLQLPGLHVEVRTTVTGSEQTVRAAQRIAIAVVAALAVVVIAGVVAGRRA